MKCRIYGISLIVFVSVLAALILRSHVPVTTVKEAVGTSAVKSVPGAAGILSSSPQGKRCSPFTGAKQAQRQNQDSQKHSKRVIRFGAPRVSS